MANREATWLAIQEGTSLTLVDGPYNTREEVLAEKNKLEVTFGARNTTYVVVHIEPIER